MLSDIVTNNYQITEVTNPNGLFDKKIDVDLIEKEKNSLALAWRELNQEEREQYKNKIANFFKEKLTQYSEDELTKAKNYSLLTREAKSRIEEPPKIDLISIDNIHMNQSLMELIENLENINHIKGLYKLRKKELSTSKNAGITTDQAKRLKNCLRQGRELFQSGKLGTLMVKPLNLFYSITAYSYVTVILNNPIRYSLDYLPGSHGINFIRDGLKIQFGGDIPQGTFSELSCSFPTIQIQNKNVNFIIDNTSSPFTYFENKFETTIGNLLSMIPEIREYYSATTGNQSKTHPLSISIKKETRDVCWEFQIGDGTTTPNKTSLDNAFCGFKMEERYGKYLVTVPMDQAHTIKACIFTDARGEFWFVENPFHPVILPEMCIHFLIINSFSNIMRYAPDYWGDILLNEVDSNLSLVTRKYISALENKFMLLVLRNISSYFPYVN